MKQNAMEMIIQIEDKAEIERLLSILNLGLCAALAQGVLSIEAAEHYLYSPYTLEMLQELDVSPKLLQVVHLGTELEDVESLLPEKLDESLAEMKQLSLEILRTLSATNPDRQWVQTKPIANALENLTNGKTTTARSATVYAKARP